MQKKCELYWPDTDEPLVCPPMKVVSKRTDKFADYEVRHFEVEKVSGACNDDTLGINQLGSF